MSPANFTTEPGAEVVFLSACRHDRAALRSLLASQHYRIHETENCKHAGEILSSRPISVLLCEAGLPGGDWRQFAGVTAASAPQLVVVSSVADDRLWAEALNLGAYDMLLTPFDAEEVSRVVALACQTWRRTVCVNGVGVPS